MVEAELTGREERGMAQQTLRQGGRRHRTGKEHTPRAPTPSSPALPLQPPSSSSSPSLNLPAPRLDSRLQNAAENAGPRPTRGRVKQHHVCEALRCCLAIVR